MFFCKDCDAYRVQSKRIAVIGQNNEAVEYVLGMLVYSPCVMIALNGKEPQWDEAHAEWMHEYEIPVYPQPITEVIHEGGQIRSLALENGPAMAVDAVFTTRGDIYHNQLAKALAAETDAEGQILVNEDCRTSVPGVYAAGCVTRANCQMIVAAGQGATAAQAINRDLFEESLKSHCLRRFREEQLRHEKTHPDILDDLHETTPQ
jgi:thioredoxin reductase (NADPH)